MAREKRMAGVSIRQSRIFFPCFLREPTFPTNSRYSSLTQPVKEKPPSKISSSSIWLAWLVSLSALITAEIGTLLLLRRSPPPPPCSGRPPSGVPCQQATHARWVSERMVEVAQHRMGCCHSSPQRDEMRRCGRALLTRIGSPCRSTSIPCIGEEFRDCSPAMPSPCTMPPRSQ